MDTSHPGPARRSDGEEDLRSCRVTGRTDGQDWDGKYYDTIHHHQTLYGVVTVTGVLTLILMMFVL